MFELLALGVLLAGGLLVIGLVFVVIGLVNQDKWRRT
jgi:hypothetical protein